MSNQLTAQPSTFLSPKSAPEAFQIAENLAKSNMIPKNFIGKPNDIVVCMAYGAELGLQPLQSLQNIAVINGNPSLWGDAMRALVLNSHDLVSLKEWDENGTFYCEITRRTRAGGEITIRKSFGDAEAQQANLLGKQGPWKQYPNRMKQMRAFGFAARDAYADRLRGFITREEAEDMPTQAQQNPAPQERDVTPQKEVNSIDDFLEQSDPIESLEESRDIYTSLLTEFDGAKTLEALSAAIQGSAKAGDQLNDEQKADLSKAAKSAKQRIQSQTVEFD